MTTLSDRRKRFKAALALADLTAGEFAAHLGVTPHHLTLVVAGERESPRVIAAVEALIQTHLGGACSPAAQSAA